MTPPTQTPADDLERIRESAARLGVQLDEEGALQWLAAIAADAESDEHIVEHESGVFGRSRQHARLHAARSRAVPAHR